ncbi:MAG: hypothetical protein JXA30_01025, partial [Deltaproteobacteria bacterium]|nr:hypothetical protein [Deltaproteobacteria bacterium]
MHANSANRIARLKEKVAGLKTAVELVPLKERGRQRDVARREQTPQPSDSSLEPAAAKSRKSTTAARENPRVAGFQYRPRKPED